MVEQNLNSNMSDKCVILDCDGCTDDAWALTFLLKAHDEKQIVLLGVTVSGTDLVTLRNAAFNIYKVLLVNNHLEIPIFLGARNVFLQTTVFCNKPPFYGRDGFGDLTSDNEKLTIGEMIEQQVVQTQHAVDGMQRFCKEHPQKVTIISTGRLTNVALLYAWYKHYHLAKDIFIMGGSYQNFGYAVNSIEYFFYADPEAAQVVFSTAKCPITILPWETCAPPICTLNLSMNWRLRLFAPQANHHPAIKLLNEVERKQFESCHYYDLWNPSAAMLTAIYLFDFQIVSKQYIWDVCVDFTGHIRGQIVLDKLKEPYDDGHTRVRVVEELNIPFFKQVAEWCAGLTRLNITIRTDHMGPSDSFICDFLNNVEDI